MNSIEKNAADEIDVRTWKYLRDHSMKAKEYPKAYQKVLEADRALKQRYRYGDVSDVRGYDDGTLPPARRAMAELQADPVKARRDASYLLDDLAKKKNRNVSVTDPVAAYRRALADVSRQYPNLARCAEDGFISNNDFQLVAMLVPAVAGEVEKGRYSREDSTRCSCGESKAYCRGRKLAQKRGVDEDNVKAFSQCILDARKHGDELDKILCYFR